jgi:hypothetical protein
MPRRRQPTLPALPSPSLAQTQRDIADLSDEEMNQLIGVAFEAAIAITSPSAAIVPSASIMSGRAGKPVPLLTRVEQWLLAHGTFQDMTAFRRAVAEALHFALSREERENYVGRRPLQHAAWLRFHALVLGETDAQIATRIAEARAMGTEAEVSRARALLGLGEGEGAVAKRTLAPGEHPARRFLEDRTWMLEHVQKRAMTDRQIADYLREMDATCDRSTVRFWREQHGLAPAWSAQRRRAAVQLPLAAPPATEVDGPDDPPS